MVGRPGVVVIVEGPKARTQRLSDEERRKVGRVAPNVPVTVLHVGHDDGSIRLDQIGSGVPVPKGIDPTKIRAVRR